MGEIAEMMLDGTMCQVCGEFMGDSAGYPVTCAGCQPDGDEILDAVCRTVIAKKTAGQKRRRYNCVACSRGFRTVDALNQHDRDKHGAQSE